MHTLTIDPVQPYLIPPVPVMAMLVGCGGTGSVVAAHLARLAWHLRDQGGAPLHLCFVDGDQVATTNIGRQQFCPAELGYNKARTLAARLSAALGVSIDTIPHMATPEVLQNYRVPYHAGPPLGLLIGAVDTVVARRHLRDVLGHTMWDLWLDGGNHERSGQVAIGRATRRTQLRESFGAGLCTMLPAPSLVYPNLVAPGPRGRPRGDCAAAMAENAQSLMINSVIAGVMGQYLVDLLIHRRLTTFATELDLAHCTMRSLAITPRKIAHACDTAEHLLLRKETPHAAS